MAGILQGLEHKSLQIHNPKYKSLVIVYNFIYRYTDFYYTSIKQFITYHTHKVPKYIPGKAFRSISQMARADGLFDVL